ncbi:MAG: MBL fold metallo-hydrolase [Chloroflexota bacterium]|nr:MBL fold metallo-hydrolase [Chloroflexota bacterium]
MHKITDHLYTFTNLLVGRVYCITDSDGLTIIDAGLGLAAKRIVSQLKRAGYAATDVKRILITHGHLDHIGGLPALKEATGAQVIASAYERPFVEGKTGVPLPKRDTLPPLARLMHPGKETPEPGTQVDRTVTDGDLLPEVFGGLRAIATPGHSPGHMSFWQPERRILITGDVVMRTPWLRLPFAAFTSDMAQSKRSLKHIAELGAEIVCFGHGVPLRRDATARLKAFAERV